MSDVEKQAVIDQLWEYERKFTAIMELIGDKRQLRGEEKTQAQQMLRELKDSLESDCKELHRNREQLNQYESAYLEPALREAKADIMIRVNTIPNNNWHSNLYGACIDITHMLHQLEK